MREGWKQEKWYKARRARRNTIGNRERNILPLNLE